MDQLPGTVVTAAGVFAGTNVDDLLVLTVLFLAGRSTGRPRRWQIVVGQYLGIATLVAVSAIAALGLLVVPERWTGLLGLLPIALGLRGLWQAFRGRADRDESSPAVAGGTWSVAGVTVANGADNISVYTPMLRTLDLAAAAVTIAVFAVLTAVWCAAGAWLGEHRQVIAVIQRAGHWLVPVVFVTIGAVILFDSGAAGNLAEAAVGPAAPARR